MGMEKEDDGGLIGMAGVWCEGGESGILWYVLQQC